MWKCKTKAIQADLVIFMHNPDYSGISKFQAYSEMQAHLGIIQAYSELCVYLAYSEPELYSEPGIFRARGIFRTLVY